MVVNHSGFLDFCVFLRNAPTKDNFLGSDKGAFDRTTRFIIFWSKKPGWLICLTRLRRDWYGWLMVRRGDVYLIFL